MPWIFAFYDGILLTEIYRLEAKDLEPLFASWEAKWNLNRRDINNPKIAVKFVRQHGELIFSGEVGAPRVLAERRRDPADH